MAIAFFDLDRTLLSENSGALWFRSEWRQGHISHGQALQAFGWLTLYHFGFARLEDSLLKSVAALAGREEGDVVARTGRFYAEQVRRLFRPGARTAIERHREAGDALVLLTTSSNYLSEPVQQELGLDAVLCNRFEVGPDGRYTGRPLGPLCYGAGKLTLGRAWAEARGIALSACSFYTDSASDLPMLEAVGRPVVVHPDPRLKRIAQQRGWEIADWGTPARA
ncbi:MAG: HAD family phosphatase [Myxococcaceae bacterium]|nr:HAD family phosphatase [Myxococcaceae bacterium]MCI0670502.1 HAD family phosphatase [Myxococcaceae bacterium]